MGKLGWIAAFVYVAGAALRLARFNTMLEVADKRYFQGLPSPAAAALVAGLRLDRRRQRDRPGKHSLGRLGGHGLCRPDDGQQSQVLQLQDDQPPPQRAVCRGVPDRPAFSCWSAISRRSSCSPALSSMRSPGTSGRRGWRSSAAAAERRPPRGAGRAGQSRTAARGRCAAAANPGYSGSMSSPARAFAPLAPIALLGGLLLLRPARR